MKKQFTSRLLALVLALGLTLGLCTGAFAADQTSGGAVAETRAAWVNEALPKEAIQSLLNAQNLAPQRTGWDKLDQRIATMLSTGGLTAYDQLWYFYDWIVKNVDTDSSAAWEGYSYQVPSLKAYNSVDGYNYLSAMTFETGLDKAVPDDMANRAYHLLMTKKGLSYDCTIAFVLAARRAGIEAYVRTGQFDLEFGDTGHHGWAILKLGGQEYIFDPQRDAINYRDNKQTTGYYFGIPAAKTTRFHPNASSSDAAANAERDAQMLAMSTEQVRKGSLKVVIEGNGTVTGDGNFPLDSVVTLTASPDAGYGLIGFYDRTGRLMTREKTYSFTLRGNTTITAKFGAGVTIEAIASRSGQVEGGGVYVPGTSADLTASSDSAAFAGWYDAAGALLSTDASVSFTVADAATYYALFEGDVFADITSSDWYRNDAVEAAARGLVSGMTPVTFVGQGTFTRAMAAVMLYRVEGTPAAAGEVPFTDIPASSWYTKAVRWAYANKIVNGRSETIFDPDAEVTRQEFFTMVGRYLAYKDVTGQDVELPFSDQAEIAGYALPSVKRLFSLGLVKGDSAGTLRPADSLTRAEGTAVVLRVDKYLESLAPETAKDSGGATGEAKNAVRTGAFPALEPEPEFPLEPLPDEE